MITNENKTIIRRASTILTADQIATIDIQVKPKHLKFIPECIARLLTKVNIQSFNLKPAHVGTMYRMAVNGSLLTETKERAYLGTDSYEQAINIVCNTAALLLENREDVPTADMINFIENNFTFHQVMLLSMLTINDTGINDIYKYYGLLEKAGIDTRIETKPFDSMQHKTIGQMLVYFKGALSEFDIKWKLTWNNYLLYLGSIAVPDNSESTEIEHSQYKAMEIADWC